MKIFLTCSVPLPLGGKELTSRSGWYIEQVADSLYGMGHEVVVMAPSHRWVNDKPYPTRSILFNPAKDNPVADPVKAHYTSFDYNFPVFGSHPLSLQKYSELSKRQLDGYVMGQIWTMTMSALVFGAPDVVLNSHAWSWNYSSRGSTTICVAQGNDIAQSIDMGDLSKIVKAGMRRVVGAIAPTQRIADALDNSALYKVDPKMIVVIPGGYRKEHFDVSVKSSRSDLLARYEELTGINEDAHWVVYSREAAHLEGMMNLVHAAQRYEAVGDRQVATIIIGLDGMHLEQAQALAKRLETKNVHFIEKLKDPSDVARFFKEAEIIVFPSGVDPVGLLNGTRHRQQERASGAFMHPDQTRGVFGDIALDDPGSAAAIRRAIEFVQRNTDMVPSQRETLTAVLTRQLAVVEGRRQGEVKPRFDKKSLDHAKLYREYTAREISIESIADGITERLLANESRTVKGLRRKAHNQSLELLSRYYAWEVVGRRLEQFLNGVIRDFPKRFQGSFESVSSDLGEKRSERLVAIAPDLEMMEAFERLRETKGTAHFPRAFRAWDKTVMEYFGKRAEFMYPVDPDAMPDTYANPFGAFQEASRAAGISVEEMFAVMATIPELGAEFLTGRSYEPPPPPSGTNVISIGGAANPVR